MLSDTSRVLSTPDPSNFQRWNSARAFATYLDAYPQLYQNRSVIELGAGGGLPGIVAALNGANTVRPCDLTRGFLLIDFSGSVD